MALALATLMVGCTGFEQWAKEHPHTVSAIQNGVIIASTFVAANNPDHAESINRFSQIVADYEAEKGISVSGQELAKLARDHFANEVDDPLEREAILNAFSDKFIELAIDNVPAADGSGTRDVFSEAAKLLDQSATEDAT